MNELNVKRNCGWKLGATWGSEPFTVAGADAAPRGSFS
jgi:hypothetical protein